MTWFGRVPVKQGDLENLSRLLEDAEAHCAAIEALGAHRVASWGRYVQLRAAVVEAQRRVKTWLGLEQPFGRGVTDDGRVDFPGLGRHRL